MFVLASLIGAGLLASATAQGAAPAGWSESMAGGVTIYRPKDASVELRLHRAEPGTSLDDWFASRAAKQPDGVSGFTPGGTNKDRPDVRLAAGLGAVAGNRVVVVMMGCQRADRLMQYAELRLPPDTTLLGRYTEPAATIVANACLAAPSGATAASSGATAAVTTTPRATAPVRGALSNADIHAIVYSWQQIYEVTGLQFHEWTYLVLKDGTVRKDTPREPPGQFDVAADRAKNPARWGRWQRAGRDYQFDFGKGWTTPPGQLSREPGRKGERFEGTYKAASSASIGFSASAWAIWGLDLSSDGTFRRWRSGGAGGEGGFGDNRVVTGTVHTDKGSASSASGPNFGGGSSRSTGVTDADLTGTYHVDGYTLELRYNNGKVQRGFFFTDDKRKHVWFEGNDLMKSDHK